MIGRENTFIEPVILFYERQRTIGDKKIIEYYENDGCQSMRRLLLRTLLQ